MTSWARIAKIAAPIFVGFLIFDVARGEKVGAASVASVLSLLIALAKP
jgi:hypothetical protein